MSTESEAQPTYSNRESTALLVRPEAESGAAPGCVLDAELTPHHPISRLPVQLDVRVPLPDFRVSDLLALEPGRVLATEWASTEDLPLLSGDVQLVWTEFEVVEQKLAVRVTRLV